MKILTVFGTRPEAIKLAPVIMELRRRSENDGIESVVCITGQHRQMLDQVLNLFDIDISNLLRYNHIHHSFEVCDLADQPRTMT